MKRTAPAVKEATTPAAVDAVYRFSPGMLEKIGVAA
jgi:hypothetical protein